MTTDRRGFIQQAGLGLAAAGLGAGAGAKTGGAGFVPCDKLERQGPKEVVLFRMCWITTMTRTRLQCCRACSRCAMTSFSRSRRVFRSA